MKLTKSQFRKLLKEYLNETRKMKKQFHSNIRDKHPELLKAHFIHWVKENPRNNGKHFSFDKGFVDRIKYIAKSNKEIACNLVDPSGQDTDPHYGDWGVAGIIFQGIPTLGGGGDLMSDMVDTPSGTRRVPILNYEGEFINDSDPDYEHEKYLYSFDQKEREQSPVAIGQENLFLRHIKDFPYSSHEWFVVPKKITGIVMYTKAYNEMNNNPYMERKGLEMSNEGYKTVVKLVASAFDCPYAFDEKIGLLYRKIYESNK